MRADTWDEAVGLVSRCQEALDVAERAGAGAYHAAFRNPPGDLAVHEIDRERRYLRVNAAELQTLGYTEAEMLGHSVSEFIVMHEASQRSIDQKLSGTKQLKPFLRTFKRRNGTAVPMVLLDRLLHDAQGQVSGIRTAMVELAAEAPVAGRAGHP